MGLMRARMKPFRGLNGSYAFNFLRKPKLGKNMRFLSSNKKWKPLYKTLFQSLSVRSGFLSQFYL